MPTDNPTLRTIVSQRPVSSQKKLSFDVEFAVSRLINKEIQGLLMLESSKKDLFYNTADFDLKEAFFRIDRRNSGFLNFDNLQEFFEVSGFFFTNEQIIDLLKRLDRNDDGKVSFEEFRRALMPIEGQIPAKMKTIQSPNRHYSEENYEDREKYDKNYDNLYEDHLINEKLERKSAEKIRKSFEKTLKTSKVLCNSYEKEEKHAKLCRKHAKPKQDFSQLFFKEQGELARTLKQFILLDKEIELMKKELCIREDFELLSTFQMMDCKGKGLLSAYELELALNKLQIFPTKYELFLFVKRYDRDFDGKFSFSDYIESFVPEELRNIVQKRSPVNENEEAEDFSEVFIFFSFFHFFFFEFSNLGFFWGF